MIFIDAREGASGDMLLAAMLGLLDSPDKALVVKLLDAAASRHGLGLRVLDIDEDGVAGKAVNYAVERPANESTSRDECLRIFAEIERDLGSESDVGGRILGEIFRAEAEAHGIPERDVHLHEIGRPQALLNIAAIGLVAGMLGRAHAGEFMCSTITTGMGVIAVSHGAIRVPAPASAILLRGMKHLKGDSPGERATPSGIAALKVLSSSQGDELSGEPKRTSTGFGSKRFGGRLGRMTLTWR
ncbi:MAG: DUF111 family protein [Thermoplasmata archaeon]|nr:DUF111 family protein [Thermoplasmata archaeon]